MSSNSFKVVLPKPGIKRARKVVLPPQAVAPNINPACVNNPSEIFLIEDEPLKSYNEASIQTEIGSWVGLFLRDENPAFEFSSFTTPSFKKWDACCQTRWTRDIGRNRFSDIETSTTTDFTCAEEQKQIRQNKNLDNICFGGPVDVKKEFEVMYVPSSNQGLFLKEESEQSLPNNSSDRFKSQPVPLENVNVSQNPLLVPFNNLNTALNSVTTLPHLPLRINQNISTVPQQNVSSFVNIPPTFLQNVASMQNLANIPSSVLSNVKSHIQNNLLTQETQNVTTTDLPVYNFFDLCRCCFAYTPKRMQTFMKPEILEILARITSLQLQPEDQENLPNFLCPTCLLKMNEIKEFSQVCCNTDKKLRSLAGIPAAEPIFIKIKSVKSESQSVSKSGSGIESESQAVSRSGSETESADETASIMATIKQEIIDIEDHDIAEDSEETLEGNEEEIPQENEEENSKCPNSPDIIEPLEIPKAEDPTEKTKKIRSKTLKIREQLDALEEDLGESTDEDITKLIDNFIARTNSENSKKQKEPKEEPIKLFRQKETASQYWYKCRKCDFSSKQLGYMRNHYLFKHKILTEICKHTNCGEIFLTRPEMENHAQSHEIARINSITVNESEKLCPICKINKFTKRKYLKMHLQRCHKLNSEEVDTLFKKENLFSQKVWMMLNERNKCSVCKKAFPNLEERDEHYRESVSCHPEPCKLCGKVLRFHRSMSQHLQTHSKELHPCEFCGKQYKYKTLIAHKATFHGKGTSKQALTRLKNLKRIKMDDTLIPSRPTLMCDICGRACIGNTGLQAHKNIHKVDPVTCSCGKTLKHKAGLGLHKLFGCPNGPKHRPAWKSCVCEICGKVCANTQSFQLHLYVHTDAKPYICSCGRNFKNPRYLNKHKIFCKLKKPDQLEGDLEPGEKSSKLRTVKKPSTITRKRKRPVRKYKETSSKESDDTYDSESDSDFEC